MSGTEIIDIGVSAVARHGSARVSREWQITRDIKSHVEDSPIKPSRTSMRLLDPFDVKDEANCQWYFDDFISKNPFQLDRAATVEEGLKAYTKSLFEQLGLDSIADILQQSSATRKILRINISDVEPTTADHVQQSVHTLHWELLEDPELWQASNCTVVLRRLVLHRPSSAFSIRRIHSWSQQQHTLNVLLVVARKLDITTPEAEPLAYRSIRDVRRNLEKRGSSFQLNVQVVRPGTFKAFTTHLDNATENQGRGYFHIVHFDLHGEVNTNKDGASHACLLFAREALSAKPKKELQAITAAKVGEVLRRSGVEVVILNACSSASGQRGLQSNLAHDLCQSGVRTILGMSYLIGNTAASSFVNAFYTSLIGCERPFSVAVKDARDALRTSPIRLSRYGVERHLQDWIVPVVYTVDGDLEIRIESQDAHRPASEPLAVTIPQDTDCSEEIELLGREFDLLRFERLFIKTKLGVITGSAGVGKSTFVKYVTDYWQETGLIERVVWINLSKFTHEGGFSRFLLETFRPYLDASNLADPSPSDLERAVQGMNVSKVAVVIDHIDAPLSESDFMDDHGRWSEMEKSRFLKLLEHMSDKCHDGGHIFLLGRRKQRDPWWETFLPGNQTWEHFELGSLDLSSATDLANSVLQDSGVDIAQRTAEEQNDLNQVIRLLDTNPLAIRHVVPAISKAGIPWGEAYETVLARTISGICRLSLQPHDFVDLDIALLSGIPRELARPLATISLFWHEGCSRDTVTRYVRNDGWEKHDIDQALEFAVDRGFLSLDSMGYINDIHPLFTIYGRELLMKSLCPKATDEDTASIFIDSFFRDVIVTRGFMEPTRATGPSGKPMQNPESTACFITFRQGLYEYDGPLITAAGEVERVPGEKRFMARDGGRLACRQAHDHSLDVVVDWEATETVLWPSIYCLFTGLTERATDFDIAHLVSWYSRSQYEPYLERAYDNLMLVLKFCSSAHTSFVMRNQDWPLAHMVTYLVEYMAFYDSHLIKTLWRAFRELIYAFFEQQDSYAVHPRFQPRFFSIVLHLWRVRGKIIPLYTTTDEMYAYFEMMLRVVEATESRYGVSTETDAMKSEIQEQIDQRLAVKDAAFEKFRGVRYYEGSSDMMAKNKAREAKSPEKTAELIARAQVLFPHYQGAGDVIKDWAEGKENADLSEFHNIITSVIQDSIKLAAPDQTSDSRSALLADMAARIQQANESANRALIEGAQGGLPPIGQTDMQLLQLAMFKAPSADAENFETDMAGHLKELERAQALGRKDQAIGQHEALVQLTSAAGRTDEAMEHLRHIQAIQTELGLQDIFETERRLTLFEKVARYKQLGIEFQMATMHGDHQAELAALQQMRVIGAEIGAQQAWLDSVDAMMERARGFIEAEKLKSSRHEHLEDTAAARGRQRRIAEQRQQALFTGRTDVTPEDMAESIAAVRGADSMDPAGVDRMIAFTEKMIAKTPGKEARDIRMRDRNIMVFFRDLMAIGPLPGEPGFENVTKEQVVEQVRLVRERLYRPGSEGSSHDYYEEDLLRCDDMFGPAVMEAMASETVDLAQRGDFGKAENTINDILLLESEGRFDKAVANMKLKSDLIGPAMRAIVALIQAVQRREVKHEMDLDIPIMYTCWALYPDLMSQLFRAASEICSLTPSASTSGQSHRVHTSDDSTASRKGPHAHPSPKLNTRAGPSTTEDQYSPTFERNFKAAFGKKKKQQKPHVQPRAGDEGQAASFEDELLAAFMAEQGSSHTPARPLETSHDASVPRLEADDWERELMNAFQDEFSL
jgi:hypothetical protein